MAVATSQLADNIDSWPNLLVVPFPTDETCCQLRITLLVLSSVHSRLTEMTGHVSHSPKSQLKISEKWIFLLCHRLINYAELIGDEMRMPSGALWDSKMADIQTQDCSWAAWYFAWFWWVRLICFLQNIYQNNQFNPYILNLDFYCSILIES